MTGARYRETGHEEVTHFMVFLCRASTIAIAAAFLVWSSVGTAGIGQTRLSGGPSEPVLAAVPSDRALELSLAQAQVLYAKAPVDARIDRVWHAIPGLCGWTLDRKGSIEETTRERDGRVHLVWDRVLPSRRLAQLPREPIYRGPDAERSVALMFNVSWGEADLPQLLTALRQKDVHATFFLDGAWVKKHPQLAREIAREGHDIGSHGSGHPDFRKLNEAQLAEQMYGTNSAVQRAVGGERVRLIAPPAGAYDRRTVRAAAQAGMYTILWSADSVDWMRPSPDRIVERVLRETKPGAFVLMHPTAPTVKALPVLIDLLRTAGYQFKTVGDVIDEEPAIRAPSVLSERE